VSPLLYVPWFHLEAWQIPSPIGGVYRLFGFELDLPRVVPVHPFGVLVALGVAVGAIVAERKGERLGLRRAAVAQAAAYVLIPAFVLAHVFDALFYHPELVLERPWYVLELWNGLSSFGGFVGAVLGGLRWAHVRQVPVRLVGDPIAYSFPFGWLFGRLGCFGVHDHPGRVTMFFLGVEDYHVGFPPYQVRHDLGFYEVLWCLAVIPLFIWLGKKERPTGFFLALLPLLYAPVRFGLDFLRATDVELADERYLGLTPGHYGAVVLFAGGLVVLAQIRRAPRLPIPAEVALHPEPEVPSASPGGEDEVAEPPAEEAGGVGGEGPENGPADPEGRE
jgi:phosphatidylglycerol:prolipoprotein diacylglycerol transferase